MSILVRDVMVRDVAYVAIPGSRDDVLKTLQDRKVSGVPVIKKGEVVGMITRTDLLRNREEDQTALLMTRDPVVISPDKSIVEASRLLILHDIRRLPVVEGKELVGIITVADIVRVAADLGIKESIEPYLEKETVVLWSEMPLSVAGSIMEFAAVEACPVIDSNLRLVGMISDRDLIKTSVIEDTVEKTDMSADDGEDTWMWDRVMQTISKYYTVSRIKLKNILVSEAMVPPIMAYKKDEVGKCASTMHKNRIDQMPVVTSSGKLMGMLKDKDILMALVDCSQRATGANRAFLLNNSHTMAGFFFPLAIPAIRSASKYLKRDPVMEQRKWLEECRRSSGRRTGKHTRERSWTHSPEALLFLPVEIYHLLSVASRNHPSLGL